MPSRRSAEAGRASAARIASRSSSVGSGSIVAAIGEA